MKEFIVIEKGSSAIRSVSQQGDRKRRLTLEAFLILLGHLLVTWGIWWFFTGPGDLPAVFEAWLGGVFLIQVANFAQRFESLCECRTLMKPDAVQGQIIYSHWSSLQSTAAHMLTHVATYPGLVRFLM